MNIIRISFGKCLFACLCLALSMATTTSLPAVEVTFLPSNWFTIANDGVAPEAFLTYTGLPSFTSPATLTQTAIAGPTKTVSNISLIKNSQGALLRNDFTMSRAGTPSSESFIVVGAEFTVSEPTTYAISGFLTANSTAALLNTFEIDADLEPAGTTNYLFKTIQQTINSDAKQFTLGLAQGTFQNQLLGSVTGTLQPGIQYRFSGSANIKNFSSITPTGTATASGFIQFSFGGVTIPEPSTITLVLLATIALSHMRRRSHSNRVE